MSSFEHPSQFYGSSIGSRTSESPGASNDNPRFRGGKTSDGKSAEEESFVQSSSVSFNPRYKGRGNEKSKTGKEKKGSGGDSEDKASTRKRFWPGKGGKKFKPKFSPQPPGDSRRESEEKDDDGWKELVEDDKRGSDEEEETLHRQGSEEGEEGLPQPVEQVMQRAGEVRPKLPDTQGKYPTYGAGVSPDVIICCFNLSMARRWVVQALPLSRPVPSAPTNVVHMDGSASLISPTNTDSSSMFQRSLSLFTSLGRRGRSSKRNKSFLVEAKKKYATLEDDAKVRLGAEEDKGKDGLSTGSVEKSTKEREVQQMKKPNLKGARKVRMSIFQLPESEDSQAKKKRDSIKAAQEFAADLEEEQIRKQLEKLL